MAEEHAPLRALVLTGMLVLVAVVVLRKYRASPGRPSPGGGWRGLLGRWIPSAGSADGVQLVHSLRLTPRTTVHVLRWNGRELLVGCSEAGVTLLGERASAASLAESKSDSEVTA